MPSEDELSELLRRGAETIHIEGRGPSAARARAQQRRRRQVGVVSLAAGLVVGVGFAGWGAWRSEPSTSIEIRQADDPAGQLDESGSIEFEWTEAEDVLTFLQNATISSDGTYYAVSTAPGLRYEDVPPDSFPADAVYRSDDLLTWEGIEQDGARLGDIDAAGGLLYAVGTTPATEGEEGAPRVSVSGDDGATWDHTALPTSLVIEDDQPFVLSSGLRLAASDDVVAALVASRLLPDLEEIAPGEENVYSEPTADGLQLYRWEVIEGDDCVEFATDAGVEPVETTVPPTTVPLTTVTSVLGADVIDVPVACETSVPLRVVPWSELGLAGPDDVSSAELFVSTDRGESWTAVDGSAFAGLFVGGLERTPEGFIAWGSRQAGGVEEAVILRSADGVTWERVDPPVRNGWIQEVGYTNGRLIAATADQELRIYVSDDSGTSWRTSSPPLDGVRWLTAAEVGPLGVALVAETINEPTALLFSSDGDDWVEVELPPEASRSPGSLNWLSVGTDRLAISAFVPGEEPGQVVTRSWVATPVR
ncbi:MAG: hypothetical protein AAFZ07_20870 [Actinomycetota bacterium]